ncbi:aftiphilin-like isoform X2 [Branchiostoma floridae]|uniref:Aftiphilin-like isoform X2 n=1 Tax=Branchiostoma floridae TaxID=7739 RepID=A0A9J7KIH7_BRAFL|nr:aftiphilin-like isoform X2 [Branchiostoma floridae]
MASGNFAPMLSSSPPPLEEGQSMTDDFDDDDFGNFSSAVDSFSPGQNDSFTFQPVKEGHGVDGDGIKDGLENGGWAAFESHKSDTFPVQNGPISVNDSTANGLEAQEGDLEPESPGMMGSGAMTGSVVQSTTDDDFGDFSSVPSSDVRTGFSDGQENVSLKDAPVMTNGSEQGSASAEFGNFSGLQETKNSLTTGTSKGVSNAAKENSSHEHTDLPMVEELDRQSPTDCATTVIQHTGEEQSQVKSAGAFPKHSPGDSDCRSSKTEVGEGGSMEIQAEVSEPTAKQREGHLNDSNSHAEQTVTCPAEDKVGDFKGSVLEEAEADEFGDFSKPSLGKPLDVINEELPCDKEEDDDGWANFRGPTGEFGSFSDFTLVGKRPDDGNVDLYSNVSDWGSASDYSRQDDEFSDFASTQETPQDETLPIDSLSEEACPSGSARQDGEFVESDVLAAQGEDVQIRPSVDQDITSQDTSVVGKSVDDSAEPTADGDEEDDFGDFTSTEQPLSADTAAEDFSTGKSEDVRTDDFGEFSAPGPSAEDGDFGEFSTGDSKEDDWASFSGPSDFGEFSQGQEKSTKEEDTFGSFASTSGPEFGDFGGFQQTSTSASTSKAGDAFLNCFPVKHLGSSEVLLELLLDIITKQSALTGPDSKGKKTTPLHLWDSLKDIDSTHALSFTWTQSQERERLLCSLGVDTRNILLPGKKALPAYAASLGMLEPTKGPLQPVSAAEKITSLTVDEPVQLKDNSKESIPPAEFDWDSSGLVNPLDGFQMRDEFGNVTGGRSASTSGSTVLNLDFFASIDDDLGTSSKSPAPLDAALMGLGLDLSPSLAPPPGSKPQSTTYNSLMASIKTSATITTPLRKDVDKDLSEEARGIMSRLPDLSFMTAKVLMFPASLSKAQEETPSTDGS